MPPIHRNLTDKQIGILLKLVREDAKVHGYGTTWKDNGQYSGWPVHLCELRTIARKLWIMREEQYRKGPEKIDTFPE